MKKEVWKPVFGFEGFYEVSSLGQVKRIKCGAGTKCSILKQRCCKKGYLWVGLSMYGKQKNYPVHRLATIAFHANPEKKPHVNHIDSNRTNNFITNLEWVTPKENTQHCIKNNRFNQHLHSLKGERNPKARLTTSQVLDIRKSRTRLREIVDKYKISYKYASKLRCGGAWKHI